MKRFQVVLVLAAVAALIGVAVLVRPRPPQPMYLEVGGTPGVQVSGTYTVDGTQYTVSGVIPLRFGFPAREVDYAIAKASEPGEIKVTLDTQLRGKISSSIAAEKGGCQGGMKLGGGVFGGRSAYCTAFINSEPATRPSE